MTDDSNDDMVKFSEGLVMTLTTIGDGLVMT
jgi:hypothetical protein